MTVTAKQESASKKTSGTSRSAARGLARLGAVQALYQMDLAATPIDDIVDEFSVFRLGKTEEGEHEGEADIAHFKDLVEGVVREQVSLDRRVASALVSGWTLARLDATLRALLRAGVYELQRCKNIPARVVINEYLDLAHQFFAEDEPRMVNAVLDRLEKELRPDEFSGDPQTSRPKKDGKS